MSMPGIPGLRSSSGLPDTSAQPAYANDTILPPRRAELAMTRSEYRASGDTDTYLDFMLEGIVPAGPFSGPPATQEAKTLSELASRLLAEGEHEALEFLLARCGPVSHLILSLQATSAESTAALGGMLRKTQPQIESLCIQGLADPDVADALVGALGECHRLSTLTLDKPKEMAAHRLFNGLCGHQTLQALHCASLRMRFQATANSLCAMLRSLPALRTLSLGLQAPEASEARIFEALCGPPAREQLQSLTLDCTALKTETAMACLGDLIGQSPSLRTLSLRASKLGAGSAAALSAALARGIAASKSLNTVALAGKALSPCAPAMIQAVGATAAPLTELDLYLPVMYPPAVLESLASLLERRPGIVSVFGNSAEDDWVADLEEMEGTTLIDEAYGDEDEGADANQLRYTAAVRKLIDLLHRNRALLINHLARAFTARPSGPVGPGHLDVDSAGMLTETILGHSNSLQEFTHVMEDIWASVNAVSAKARPATTTEATSSSAAAPGGASDPDGRSGEKTRRRPDDNS